MGFWQDHLNRPVDASQSTELAKHLWAGVPDELRSKLWLLSCREEDVSADYHYPEPDGPKLPQGVAESIDLDLESGHFAGFSPTLLPADYDRIRRVLRVHVARHDSYPPGTAHLVARLLSALGDSEADAFRVLQSLTRRMRDYTEPGFEALRNDVLALAHILVEDMPKLASHFNSHDFDVVDLCDIVRVWMLPLFASHFPLEVVRRVVDTVLLEGPDFVMALVFGLLKVAEPRLLEVRDGGLLFQTVADIPGALKRHQISEAFRLGYKCLREGKKGSRLLQVRQSKDWFAFMTRAGAVTFVADVGDPTKNKPEVIWPPPRASEEAKAAFQNLLPSSVSPARVVVSATSRSDDPTPHGAKRHSRTQTAPSGGSAAPLVRRNAERLSDDERTKMLTALDTMVVGQDMDLGQLRALLQSSRRAIAAQHATITKLQNQVGNSKTRDASTRAASPSDKVAAAAAPAASASMDQAKLPRPQPTLRKPKANTLKPRDGKPQYKSGTLPRPPTGPSGRVSLPGPGLRISKLPVVKRAPENGIIRHSELLDYIAFPCLYMEGHLMKSKQPSKLFRRKKATGFFGNLHRRMFLLQGPFLTYFKSRDESKPKNDISVDMRGRQVMVLHNHEYGPFAFQICKRDSQECLYLLFASSEHDREVWVNVLQISSHL